MNVRYTVIIENKAQKEFLRLSPPDADSVEKCIASLEREPRPRGVKKLAASGDGYRIRVGHHRILYTIEDRRGVVTIYRIRHRREAYR